MIRKPTRTPGEYPFYPMKPEHEVLKPVGHRMVIDTWDNQPMAVIDYSAGAGPAG